LPKIALQREDAVCLGDFCDVVRCSVMDTILTEEAKSTDISVWVPHNGGISVSSARNKSGAMYEFHKKSAMHVEDATDAGLIQCDEKIFSKLKGKCEDLVWSCMKGLINLLDLKDFKTVQSTSRLSRYE
jgi:hypothetical protein